jgi:hypothetical protein
LGDNARLVAIIPDREYHLSRDEVAALSRRLVENIRSPLVDVPLDASAEHAVKIVDLMGETNREYISQLASPASQLLEVSVYGRYMAAWPGFRLLAEWLKHHLACEVYLGSDYGYPWVAFDPDTVSLQNQRYMAGFCEDDRASSQIGLPWPENTAPGAHAVIAARFDSKRFSPALESLCAILSHHRKYQGRVPISADGPAMAIYDVLPEPRSNRDHCWQPVYRPDDPPFAIPHAHRFAVIPTTLSFADAANLDAWPYARFLLEMLTLGLGGEPVYGVVDENDVINRPRLLSGDDMTMLTRTYLGAM